MTFAKVVLSGTVASQPEKRFTPNNVAITNFELTVTPLPRFNGQVEEPYNIKIACWNRLADAVVEQLKQGDQVIVEGKLMMNSFQTAEGVQKKAFEIEANTVSKYSGEMQAITAAGAAQSGAASYGPAQQAASPATEAVGVAAAAPPVAPTGQLPPEESLTEDDIPF